MTNVHFWKSEKFVISVNFYVISSNFYMVLVNDYNPALSTPDYRDERYIDFTGHIKLSKILTFIMCFLFAHYVS